MSESRQLLPGAKFSQSVTVTDDLTVREISPLFTSLRELPPVFATAYLIAFMEWTCHEAVRAYLSENERTVGTSVTMKHTTATPVGMKVTAEVELTGVNGKMLQFAFTCLDEAGPIAEGSHERAVIDYERFMARLAQKSGR